MQFNSDRVNRGFHWAKEASKQSVYPQHHLGAAVVYKGVLLAVGYNSNKTSPVQKEYNKQRDFDVDTAINSLHAECACLNKIRRLNIDFSKAVLFVYRERKNGKRAMARPCRACMQYVKDLGIKHVYYTTDDGWAHEIVEV